MERRRYPGSGRADAGPARGIAGGARHRLDRLAGPSFGRTTAAGGCLAGAAAARSRSGAAPPPPSAYTPPPASAPAPAAPPSIPPPTQPPPTAPDEPAPAAKPPEKNAQPGRSVRPGAPRSSPRGNLLPHRPWSLLRQPQQPQLHLRSRHPHRHPPPSCNRPRRSGPAYRSPPAMLPATAVHSSRRCHAATGNGARCCCGCWSRPTAPPERCGCTSRAVFRCWMRRRKARWKTGASIRPRWTANPCRSGICCRLRLHLETDFLHEPS